MFNSLTWRWIKRCLVAAFVFSLAVATGGCRQGPWEHWQAYSARFINADGRVVDFNANDHTTSEGQSYALFFALVANDRPHFDKLLSWTENNLAGGDMSKQLPGWLWGKTSDGQWKLLDPNPAADSDCWIAYDLLEAGRLWNVPSYTELGRHMLDMIAKQEVADLPGFGTMLMPGKTAEWVHETTWTLNPSYVPVFLFDRFAAVDPTGPWAAISMNTPRMIRQSARRGFAMDWVDYVPNDGFYPASAPAPPAPPPDPAKTGAAKDAKPASPAAQKGAVGNPKLAETPSEPAAKPPMGSYDAIRVYLWAGMMDPKSQTRSDLVNSLSGMSVFLSNPDHQAPPEKVDAQGIPEFADGPIGFSAAVLPYLWKNQDLARAAAQQRVRISGQIDSTTGLYGKSPVYYDQNLVLFALGYLDGRFKFGSRGELTVEWTR